MSFKVLDDIKDSVRTAATKLARTLTGMLVRNLEAAEGSSKQAQALLKGVLPFLFSTSGLDSPAKGVQGFALKTVLDIIKKSRGEVLRPFIDDLIERLLNLTSSLEPEGVNYLHLNADKYKLTGTDIDKARASATRSSPLMDAIERCLDLLDAETLDRVALRLQNTMKAAPALPTKVAAIRVVISLSTRHAQQFKKWYDVYLGLLEKLVQDRSEVAASQYATASGYLARGSSEKQLLSLAVFLRRIYSETDDLRPRITCAEILTSIAKQANDRFNALATAFVPLIFVGRHDEDAEVKKLFEELWSENVGGPRAVVLYASEIVELIAHHLQSRRWHVKHAAAISLAKAIEAIVSCKGRIASAEGYRLWPALKMALVEKSWVGKEHVLTGYLTFVKHAEDFWKPNADVATELTKASSQSLLLISIREARRRNDPYRQHAIEALGKYAELRHNVDLFSAVAESIEPILEESAVELKSDEDAMEIDSGGKGDGVAKVVRASSINGGAPSAICLPDMGPSDTGIESRGASW
ncbi:hypothetical protein MRB53_037677 [Persea americana]|nr:hypothetical protein MRB53_037677 [Persea americana]